MHPITDMRLVPFLALAAALAACARGDEDRVRHYAMAQLGLPAPAMRITPRTELTGDDNDFFQVTADKGRSLVVVVPSVGPIFDARTAGAFDRVARAEHATERLSQLGAERVAAWFGALGGGVCPPPPLDQAHFTEVIRNPDGSVAISYPAGRERKLGVERTCVFELAPDGALKSGRTVEVSAPRAASSWKRESHE